MKQNLNTLFSLVRSWARIFVSTQPLKIMINAKVEGGFPAWVLTQ